MTIRGGIAALVALCLLVAACQAAPLPPPTSAPPTATPVVAPSPVGPSPVDSPTAAVSTPSPIELSPSPLAPSPATAPPTAPPTPTDDPSELRIERTLPYATEGDCGERVIECKQFVDVYAPPGRGPWPVVVMIHGRPRTPRDMAPLAREIAGHGAVVYNADYRGVRPIGAGWPEAPEDVACAVRYARATAHRYGGDPSTLVLVGHSYGGYLAPLIALAGDEFDGECLYSADEVSALPTDFVGIAGNYVVEREPVWDRWYGGTPEERPDAWRMGNFRTHLGGNPELRVRLIHERGDPIIPPRQPRRFHRALRQAGYDTRLQIIEGNAHFALLDPDGNGRLVVPLILELLGIDE